MASRDERYQLGDDDLIVERVGPWANTKHKLLTDYVQASGGARASYVDRSGAAFIDVFCGTGRSIIRDTGQYIDGSPLVAFKHGLISPARFSSIEISDADSERLAAAETRLKRLNAPVVSTPGPAIPAMRQIAGRVHQHGLHCAFLDPHNLGALSFELFEILATLHHVDVIVHVSVADLRRNADLYTADEQSQFDTFAPGWREAIDYKGMSNERLRAAILNYWSEKVSALGLTKAKHSELITAPGGQQLYLLSLLSRADLAHKLWTAISSAAKQPIML